MNFDQLKLILQNIDAVDDDGKQIKFVHTKEFKKLAHQNNRYEFVFIHVSQNFKWRRAQQTLQLEGVSG